MDGGERDHRLSEYSSSRKWAKTEVKKEFIVMLGLEFIKVELLEHMSKSLKKLLFIFNYS